MSNKRLTAVWDKSNQKGTKLLALLSLADRADDDGYCWPSHEDTARRTRSARSYVLKMLTDIEADGELYVHRRPGKTHRYLVIVGMSKTEIRKAMKRRFDYTAKEITAKLKEIDTCQQNGHVSSTEQVVSAKQTGGVSSTEHEPSLTQREPKGGKSRKRDARLDHPAIIAYRDIVRLHVPISWRDDVCKVRDIEKWKSIVKSWEGKNYKKGDVESMLDVYKNGWRHERNGTNKPAAPERDLTAERLAKEKK